MIKIYPQSLKIQTPFSSLYNLQYTQISAKREKKYDLNWKDETNP